MKNQTRNVFPNDCIAQHKTQNSLKSVVYLQNDTHTSQLNIHIWYEYFDTHVIK